MPLEGQIYGLMQRVEEWCLLQTQCAIAGGEGPDDLNTPWAPQDERDSLASILVDASFV